MKSMVTSIENKRLIIGLNVTFHTAEERVSELEDKSEEVIPNAAQGDSRWKYGREFKATED